MGDTVTLQDLPDVAARLWDELPQRGVLWLSGDLGTGKTTLVGALTAVAGAERARSPSFALVHEYACPGGLVVHADCYRLRTPDEALDLDLDGLARSARLLVVEWPERAGPYAPPPDIHLRLAHAGDPDRRRLERVS